MYFHQLIGIAKGSIKPPSCQTYFFIIMKGSGFFKQKAGTGKASNIPNIFRFLDDLHTFNNNEFENNYNDIYPSELELKKKNEDPCKVCFWIFQ